MDQIVPYLNFSGNCEEALTFYKDVFGGEITVMMRYDGSPVEVTEDQKDKVLHSQFKAGNIFFMASDAMHGKPAVPGDTISLNINFYS